MSLHKPYAMSIKDRFPRLLHSYRYLRDQVLYLRRSKFLPQINKMITPETTIISSNTFAGRILQDLGREYNTPTVGLVFWAPDYIEFLSNLEHYLKAEIIFTEKSKYPEGDVARASWHHWYPIGLLDGKVEIHFLHYYSEKEAAEKWHRRAKRVNMNNLFIVGMDQNQASEEGIKQFDRLPYKNKIFFSRFTTDCNSNEFMPEFVNEIDGIGDPYKNGHLFYKHMVRHFNHFNIGAIS